MTIRHFSVSEIRTPVCVILRCDCGWQRQISRRQNAWARAAKARAEISRRLKWHKEDGRPLANRP